MRKNPRSTSALTQKESSQRNTWKYNLSSQLPKLVAVSDDSKKTKEKLSLSIIDLSHDGRGVAKREGKIIFVAGALPNETVTAQLQESKKNFAEAKLLTIEQASEHRVTADCPHYGRCGGCQLQHLSYTQQVIEKQQQLVKTLVQKNLGLFTPLAPIVATGLHYRRRAKFVLNHHHLCFRSLGGKTQEIIKSCLLLEPSLDQLLQNLTHAFEQKNLSTNAVFELEMTLFDQLVVVIKVGRHWTEAQQLKWQHWLTQQAVHLLVIQTADHQNHTYYLTDTAETQLTETVNHIPLSVTWDSFVQANRVVNQQMVQQAIDWLAPNAHTKVLDLFCGIGNFSFALATMSAEVLGIENNLASLQVAKQTAQGLATNKVSFLSADLFDSNTQLPAGYDALLLDPPRDGADQVCQKLKRHKEIQRIVYVSCHLGSLQRDLVTLTQAGFKIIQIGLVDQFPQTYHIESMVLLSR